MKEESLSVVVPAYNEEARIASSIERLHGYLEGRFKRLEIIVVDDGSADSTRKEAAALKGRFPALRLLENSGNRGKGYSVRKGVMASKGSLILMSDADLSTPVEEIEKLLPQIECGFDIAIGSRALSGSDVAVRQPWYRERMGKAFNLFVRLILMAGFRDTQCGFKLFRREAALSAFEKARVSGFGFDAEVLYIAGLMGYRIKEVPVRWLDAPPSQVRIVRDSARMLAELFIIRLNRALGRYEG